MVSELNDEKRNSCDFETDLRKQKARDLAGLWHVEWVIANVSTGIDH